MTLVMFDVDGTLTHSNELDTHCFVQAMREVFGFDGIDEDWSHYPHTSDAGIIEELFQRREQRSPRPEELTAYKAHFLRLLAAGLQRSPMSAIAGAGELLAMLGRNEGVAIALASGAWRESARAKMLSAGLPFDRYPGGFSEQAAARVDIMKAARRQVEVTQTGVAFQRWVYFGDAVWDARACRELDIPLIGIGNADRAELLLREGACAVLADYSQPEAVLAAIAHAGSLQDVG